MQADKEVSVKVWCVGVGVGVKNAKCQLCLAASAELMLDSKTDAGKLEQANSPNDEVS